MPGSPAELTLSGPARPEFLDQMHDLLAELWQAHPDVAEVDRLMFTTAVLEVSNNILTHGAASMLSVAVRGDSQELEAELTDDGAAADLDLDAVALPDGLTESGRGLAMVQLAVDEVSHDYAAGLNHWHLRRRRVS